MLFKFKAKFTVKYAHCRVQIAYHLIKLVYLYRYTDLKHFKLHVGWKSTSNWQTNNLIISLFHKFIDCIILFYHASENVYEFYAIYESLFEAFCECERSEQNQNVSYIVSSNWFSTISIWWKYDIQLIDLYLCVSHNLKDCFSLFHKQTVMGIWWVRVSVMSVISSGQHYLMSNSLMYNFVKELISRQREDRYYKI